MQLLFYSLVVLIPLVHAPYLNAAVFGAPKLLVLRVITLMLLLVWLIIAYRDKKICWERTWYDWGLFGMATVAMLTTIFSNFFWTSFLGIDGRFMGLITVLNLLLMSFLAVQYFATMLKRKRFELIERLMRVSLIVAVILAIYGVLQGQAWFEELTRDGLKWAISPKQRSFSTFGHSTHFGAYLAMHLPIAMVYVLRRNWKKKMFGIAGILVLIWGILLTGSRGPLAAGVVGLVVMGVVVAWMNRDYFKRGVGKKVFLFAAGVTVLVGILLGIYRAEIGELKTVKRTEAMIELWRGGGVTDRQSWWLSSLAMWAEEPVLGHGLSTYSDSYNAYRRLDYRVPEDEQDYIVPHYAHMEFLNILATQGIVGLVVYLAMIGYVFWLAIRFVRKNKNSTGELALALSVGVMIYLLHSLFSFGVVSTLSFFYLFMGLTVALCETTKRREVSFKLFEMLLMGILLVVIGMAFSFKYYFADVMLNWAQREKLQNMDAYYERAIAINPNEYSYYMKYGDRLLKRGLVSDDSATARVDLWAAIEEFQKAKAINDAHPIIDAHMGMAYDELAKMAFLEEDMPSYREFLAEAVQSYKLAVEKGPNNPLYAYDLGKLLYRNDLKDEAVVYLEMVKEIREGFRDVEEVLEEIDR